MQALGEVYFLRVGGSLAVCKSSNCLSFVCHTAHTCPQVADFLQDQGMLEAAAKSANYTLIRPSRPGKASSLHPKDVFNSFVDALQSMPAHLSQAVLSAGTGCQKPSAVRMLKQTRLLVTTSCPWDGLQPQLHCGEFMHSTTCTALHNRAGKWNPDLLPRRVRKPDFLIQEIAACSKFKY